MKTFRLYFIDGNHMDIKGLDPQDAIRRHGLGVLILLFLDYWEEVMPMAEQENLMYETCMV